MTERDNRRQQGAGHHTGDDPSGDSAWDGGAANLAGMSGGADSAPFAPAPAGGLAPDIRQVVFIDSSVADAELLAKGVAPGVVAVLLSAGSDGVAQIAAWLASHGAAGLSAIDIVSHGQDGVVTLGNATLDSATIVQYSSDLAAIGAALQPGGDIQLYGCDVAQDATGDAFLQQLSAATGGAHVAAASHLVGAASGGGSWSLDVNTGAIDVSAPFTAATMSVYPDELALTTNQLFAAYFNEGTFVEEIGVTNSGTPSGSSTEVNSSGFSSLQSIAVDAPTEQYFVSDDDAGVTEAILEGSTNGGSPTTIFSVDPNNYFVNDVALDQPNGTLYFTLLNYGPSSTDPTGIYKININDTAAGATRVVPMGSNADPNALSLDTGDGLVFFTDLNDVTTAGQTNLDVANLGNGSITVLNTPGSSLENILKQSTVVNGDTVVPGLEGIAYDAANHTLFFETLPKDLQGFAQTYDQYYGIYSAPVTINGGSVSLGNVTTLYKTGAGDDYAISITLDTQDNRFYIGDDPNSGNFDGGIYESSMSGGGLHQVYQSSGHIAIGLDFLSQPTIVAGGTVTYKGPGSPVTLDSGATVSNSDGQELESATVSVAGGTAADGDLLAATTGGTKISASYNPTNEVLTLTGVDTAAHYQQVLDSVTFSSDGVGTTGTRTIDWTVTDGIITSPTAMSYVDDICFCSGTKIATPDGEVAVERLSAGDMVLTASGAVRPIIWVGMGRKLCTRGKRTAATPVIVTKNALGPGVPRADLYITKAHALYVDDVLIPVEFLINHRSIRWDDRALEVKIYHIELETHDVLIANGAPAESYRDDGNRWLFHNANSGWGLPPQEPCAPVLTGGPIVDAAWRRYLDMSGPRKLPPLTDDPDLHLVVDGQRVDAVRRGGQEYAFRLPAVPEAVRIVSRDTVPAELGLVRDPRSLGVAVRSVTLQQGAKLALIEAEDDRLSDGFHGYEPAERLRWTSGDAGLPASVFAGFTGAVEVTIQLCGSTQYPVYFEAVAA